MVALLLIGGRCWDLSRMNELRSAEIQTITEEGVARSDMSNCFESAWTDLAYTDDDVSDPSTLDNLKVAYETALVANGLGLSNTTRTPVDEMTCAALLRSAETNRTTTSAITEACDGLGSAIDSVDASKHARDLEKSRSALQAALDAARTTLDSSDGSVEDESTRTALSTAIDAATPVLDQTDVDDCAVYDEQASALNSSVASVTASVSAKEEADAAAARRASTARYSSQEEAQSAAQSGGSVSQASDGTWYVTYTVAHGSTPSSSDGGVYEFEDGYYIAHRSDGANGRRIASLGAGDTVVVGGREYVYAGEETVAIGSDYEPVSEWVHSDGGIGFQTCTGDGSTAVVKKMVPVD